MTNLSAVAVHHCHWPSCSTPVEPARWGCVKHWFVLPKSLRDRVWAAYVPGQEISKTPSARYIQVAREVQAWALEYEANQALKPPAAAKPVKPAKAVEAQIGLDF